MEDSHTNLPKKYRTSLKKHYVYKVSELRLLPFLISSKTCKFISQNAFPAHAISPKSSFTGNGATPMANYSKSKGRHASSLQSTQTTLQKLDKPLIKLILSHHFAPAAETHINPYESLVFLTPGARSAPENFEVLDPVLTWISHSERN